MSALATQPSAYKSNQLGQQLQLPKILHSASKLGDPQKLNVTARGVSRASSLGDLADKIDGRPLAFEHNDDSMSFFMNSKNNIKLRSASKHSTLSKNTSLNSSTISIPPAAALIDTHSDADYYDANEIPDGIKVVYSASLSGKPSIPIFGMSSFRPRLKCFLMLHCVIRSCITLIVLNFFFFKKNI
jgi:hypothetical protein